MSIWSLVAVALLGIPLSMAVWANRPTTLLHALLWAVTAWLAWIWNAATGEMTARYISLCLTACAGVAVLGARRPGAAAWNAVVAGLLAVLMIPLAQELFIGASWLSGPLWKTFLGITLAVGILNYLPTRLWLSSIALFAASLAELRSLENERPAKFDWLLIAVVAAIFVSTWSVIRGRKGGDQGCDSLWCDFRDRFGFVWAQRLREQFNAAAQHAHFDVGLTWNGLRTKPGAMPDENQSAAAREMLSTLVQRFGMR
jgi:hypothetical protein